MFDRIKYYSILLLVYFVNVPILIFSKIEYVIKCVLGNTCNYNSTFKMCKFVYKWIEKYVFKSEIIYLNPEFKFEKDKNYILMPNHQTYLDCSLAFLLPNRFTAVAIGYLENIPIIGSLCKTLDFTFTSNKTSIVSKISNKLKNNNDMSLIIFPEGGRYYDENFKLNLLAIKTGGFAIAKELGYDIIPVYHNFYRYFKDNLKIYTKLTKPSELSELSELVFTKNVIIVGNPIQVNNLSVDEIKSVYIDEMNKILNL